MTFFISVLISSSSTTVVKGAPGGCYRTRIGATLIILTIMLRTWRRSGSRKLSWGRGVSVISGALNGGAIATLFLQRHRVRCDAIALTAPMFGIVIRLPSFMVRHILDWAEGHQRIREDYAIGTGQWRALPFGMNALTHSRQRYQRNLRFYADEPQLRVGGPTALGTRRHSGG